MSQHSSERIELLDITRGFAILGILLMNIRMFSEPHAAYFNPLVYGDYTGLNKGWWIFQTIFADQKFMAIFSMLFGASTAIICDNLARKEHKVGLTYFKRIFGLLLIGLAHAYLLWFGDILVPYALAAWVPFLLRNKSWKTIASVGVALLVFGTVWSIMGHYALSYLVPEAELTKIIEGMWLPTAAMQATEVAIHQGSWLEQFAFRQGVTWEFQTDTYLNWGFWRVSGVMLLGLALYRQGFLRGALEGGTYGKIALLCLPMGFALTTTGFVMKEEADWIFPVAFLLLDNWNYWGSLFIGTGYMASLAFLLKSTNFRFGFKALSNVGKAALSNYIFQTVACTTIFYGYGFGLFGKLERAETALVIVGVWATQIFLSHLWFKNHQRGPLENIWHRFTYSNWFGSPAHKKAAE